MTEIMNEQKQRLSTEATSIFAKIAKAISSAHKLIKGKSEYERMEEYLAESFDIQELEDRMRAWDKRQLNQRLYF